MWSDCRNRTVVPIQKQPDFPSRKDICSSTMWPVFSRLPHRSMLPVKKTKTYFGIPYDWTPADREVRSVLGQYSSQVFVPKPVGPPWYHNISVQHTRDFLGDLYSYGLIEAGRSWVDLLHPDSNDPDKVRAKLVNQTIYRLQERLQSSLVCLTEHGISRLGGVLYYTDRIDRCLVYEYNLSPSQRAAKVEPCAQIVEPDYLYDIDSAIGDIDPEIRSSLKGAVIYGHKIVAHRNTLVHVDRRKDIDTAGPFIDTIILNDMLHSYLYEYACEAKWSADSPEAFRSAIDIGCGNGLLITSAAQNLPSLQRVVALDPNVFSVVCANRNFAANNRKKRLISICGMFSDFPFSDIDLAICNPPYIPAKPGSRSSQVDALVGTQLLSDVILASPTMLSPQGFLFMVFSSLADREFEQAVNQAKVEVMPIGPPKGFKVRFEQPTILRDPQQRDFLVQKKGLDYTEKRKEYHHVLRCVAIRRSSTQGFEGSASLLKRIGNLTRTLEQD